MPTPVASSCQLMMQSPVTATDRATVADVMAVMEERHVQHVLITREARLVGILSDRDLLGWLPPPAMGDAARAFSGQLSAMTVDLLMTRRPLSVGPTTSVEVAVALMSEAGIHALPVVDRENRPLGIVTLRDVAFGLLQRAAA